MAQEVIATVNRELLDKYFFGATEKVSEDVKSDEEQENEDLLNLMWDLFIQNKASSISKKVFKERALGIFELIKEDCPNAGIEIREIEKWLNAVLDKATKRVENSVVKASNNIKFQRELLAKENRNAKVLVKDLEGLKKDLKEVESLVERYEKTKRLPNAEAENVHVERNHFTCSLCGCSIGRMKTCYGGEWGWKIPNFCPNCGARVAGTHFGETVDYF